jgi:guanosine-3',5'-bis(diphosphate) 3'-pyrophosphohydrolase
MHTTAAPIDTLVAKVRSYDPTLDPEWLHAVYELADRAHDGQLRASGESYIEHPVAVAQILAEMEMDRATTWWKIPS